MIQLNMELGNKLREAGMAQAVDHANAVHQDWSEKAFEFLKVFIKSNPMFMTEDLRYASQGIVPSPASQRAWGSIIRRAALEGLIFRSGYGQVKNSKAHRANAGVWKVRPIALK